MNIPLRPYLLLGFSVALIACSRQPALTTPPIVTWPPLSEFAAVSGRAATQEDVSAGRAVFVLGDVGKPIGVAISIPVPQYAFHRDEKAGIKTPCVVIQAEEGRGHRVLGARMLPDRSIMFAGFSEFELLGTTPPTTQQ